ncbi:MAG: response regulator transcription factor [Sphingobacteriales bacterium]|nr:MAG: response regulator transcription factor [Sphingobacteriales bacterium]
MAQTILLVEDEKKIADTIKSGLSEHGYTVSTAYDGNDAKELIENNKYDLIILDINLPGINGYELCTMIREKDKMTPIVLLTALNLTENKVQGLELGADDYIAKPFEFRELVARIRALLRRIETREMPGEEKILKIANLELNLDSKEVKRDNQKIGLTAKEFQLLEYFLRNRGKVVSRADIAKSVWDINFDTQTNVIDVYINFLRKKIDKQFTPKLIHTHVGIGYVLKAEAD